MLWRIVGGIKKNVGLGFAVQRNSTKGARVMINRKGFGKS